MQCIQCILKQTWHSLFLESDIDFGCFFQWSSCQLVSGVPKKHNAWQTFTREVRENVVKYIGSCGEPKGHENCMIWNISAHAVNTGFLRFLKFQCVAEHFNPKISPKGIKRGTLAEITHGSCCVLAYYRSPRGKWMTGWPCPSLEWFLKLKQQSFCKQDGFSFQDLQSEPQLSWKGSQLLGKSPCTGWLGCEVLWLKRDWRHRVSPVRVEPNWSTCLQHLKIPSGWSTSFGKPG